jgi:two-component system, LytTR family, sensor kinase
MNMLRKIPGYWLCQVAGWGLYGLGTIVSGVLYLNLSTDWLIKVFLQVALGIFSTHILRWVIKKNRWLMLPVDKVVIRLAIASVLTSILYSLLVMVINQAVGFDANRRNLDFSQRLLANTLNLGLLIIPWVLIYYFYHYIEKSLRQQIETLKLESLVKELELKTIKSHINPHFIFNALNSIRALIDENPARARNAVTHLGNILRSSMQSESLATVPFEKELNIVKDYLALEHIRFEERLTIEYDIDAATLSHPVPPMMLQTLVENAIKHGINKDVNGGMVKVTSDFRDRYHELIVQNTGQLNGHAGHPGFGLSSTRSRLNLLFGDKANFDITQNGNLVEARVLLPRN